MRDVNSLLVSRKLARTLVCWSHVNGFCSSGGRIGCQSRSDLTQLVQRRKLTIGSVVLESENQKRCLSSMQRRRLVSLVIYSDPDALDGRHSRTPNELDFDDGTAAAAADIGSEAAAAAAAYDPSRFGFIEIGTIAGPHGVRGECKVRLNTDFARERLPKEPAQRYIKLAHRVYPRPVWVQDGRPASQANVWIIRVRGVEDRDAASQLRGACLYVHESEQRPQSLGADEYIITEWIGRPAILRETLEKLQAQADFLWTREWVFKHCLGRVAGVILRNEHGGAHDALELLLFEGNRSLEVPFLEAFVQEMDIAAHEGAADAETQPPSLTKLAVLDLPPGMLDLARPRERKKRLRIRGYLPPCRTIVHAA